MVKTPKNILGTCSKLSMIISVLYMPIVLTLTNWAFSSGTKAVGEGFEPKKLWRVSIPQRTTVWRKASDANDPHRNARVKQNASQQILCLPTPRWPRCSQYDALTGCPTAMTWRRVSHVALIWACGKCARAPFRKPNAWSVDTGREVAVQEKKTSTQKLAKGYKCPTSNSTHPKLFQSAWCRSRQPPVTLDVRLEHLPGMHFLRGLCKWPSAQTSAASRKKNNKQI